MFDGKIFFTSPNPNGKTEWTGLKILPNGTKEWYGFNSETGEWVITSTENPVNTVGVTANYTSNNLKITKLSVVNGLITELEAE